LAAPANYNYWLNSWSIIMPFDGEVLSLSAALLASVDYDSGDNGRTLYLQFYISSDGGSFLPAGSKLTLAEFNGTKQFFSINANDLGVSFSAGDRLILVMTAAGGQIIGSITCSMMISGVTT